MKRDFINEMILQGFNTYDNSRKTIKDIGEHATLLFAYFLELPYIHAEDSPFSDYVNENKDKFSDIEIIGLSAVLSDLVSNDKERIKVTTSIERKRVEYTNKLELSKKLLRFKDKFNSR